MTFNREKISFYLKGLLCISWIALWSFWFTNFSGEEHHKLTKHNSSHPKKITSISKKPETDLTAEIPFKKMIDIITAEKITTKVTKKNNLENELPKLVTLTPPKTNPKNSTIPGKNKKELVVKKEADKKPELEKTNHDNKPGEMINLILPETASATRKVLLSNKPSTNSTITRNKVTLRKGAKVETNRFKPVSLNIKEKNPDNLGQEIYLTESWLTKPSEKNKPPKLESKDIIENPDKIAEEIELAGIVNKPNGETTAIIKNKSTNYIEVLKKGDQYKGFKLLEIKKNEILLESPSLNKTYIKKLNVGITNPN